MAKAFMEVFPGLELSEDIRDLFAQTEVERVATTRNRDILRIYMNSERLIQKPQIYKAEQTIRQQLFPRIRMSVKIIEKFRLSEQYSPRTLMDVYYDSILTEFKNYSRVEYNLFAQAKWEFAEDRKLTLHIPDSVVAREKSDEIVRVLEKIFCERCGMDLITAVEYEAPKESKYRKNSEEQIAREIQEIVRHTKGAGEGPLLEAKGADLPWDDAPKAEKPAEKAENRDKETKEKAAGQTGASRDKGGQNGQAAGGRTFQKKEFRKGGFQKNGGGFAGGYKRSDNPDVLYGRDFEDHAIAMDQILGEMGEVTVRGQISSLETREIRGEKTIIIMNVTDFTDTMSIKIFTKNEFLSDILGGLKQGGFIKLKGVTTIDKFDSELTIGSVVGIKKIPDFRVRRMDTSAQKRVELHCHTKMSDMDGVSDVKDLIGTAISWGHKALAVTDHGIVQAFPDANHAVPKGSDFKVIYGVEAYLVDDLKQIVQHARGQKLDDTYVVFDIETTGFSNLKNKIIEIGAVKVVGGVITEKFSTFVNPQVPIPFEIEHLTGINDNMVLEAPAIDRVLPAFMEFCQDAVMVAHNADFDMGFIKRNLSLLGMERDFTIVDTVAIARILLPNLNRFKLDTVAKALNISLENHHRAVDDAGCTAEIFVKFVEMLKQMDVYTLDDLNRIGKLSDDAIRKLHSYHAIILAKNETGRLNLYRLISASHLQYFQRQPKIPKSLLMKYREGLILGSACEAGELFRALVRDSTEEDIARIVNFYDYLEIQPIGNNMFMLRDKESAAQTEEDLRDYNRRIVALGEQFNKPVVATCDVHFLNPEDEVYRRIIMASKGFKDADDQAPLFLRTTEEMLKEFEYLGSRKAEEVVITNTNRIADAIEPLSPVRPDKCPPVIPDSDKMLREICYTKAHEIYGENLPDIVTERLERELNSIISNGFAVMYIIAQKLVWKSNEDGYLVGSRGSVGSSFVATMAGITEVNPLSPHYYCASCHYSDFDSEEVKAFGGRSGCDMPDKTCPVCGAPLKKDGFDIPFETFLGFKGNKEPDIDLNFSGEYQSNAHKYTEVIFGAGQTFRAGTIGTVAEKTAFGYVRGYFEDKGIRKRSCEIERIASGCVGIHRTTGQHPGGIIVLPLGEEINSFTPVQHPANDMTTDIITTHFDYHSIDHNLLKLDILGHDDPTMIRMLEDLIGFDAKKIPLDDRKVMTLFQNTSALGITPEDIGGTRLGSLGIPEFGTEFAMQMLIDTKPTSFSDLVRIAGLAHGTDVWLGNAQTLILEGKATISTAICTRDDIMIYLISKGLDSEESFKIMEAVRKGTVAKGKCDNWPEWKADMIAHDVPDWYIWSCEKIKYMFPKAHAAAYVMMAWRIAYCKVYHPLAYYAAYFSIRATSFNYELMCLGKERLEYHMKDYEARRKAKQLSNKEEDTLKDMKLVQEMYARGFDFVPIDIFRAEASRFQIIDGKLMPALATIDGMGDKAAEAIVDAAKDGPFLSKDDFRQRTKVPKTVVDLMDDLNLLGDLPESNQLSLFDFT